MRRVLFALVALSLAMPASGCLIVSRDHLDELERGPADSGAQDAGAQDAGAADTGPPMVDAGPSLTLVDMCGAANAFVLEDSTGGQFSVRTDGLNNRLSSCGSQAAPGNDGFLAIDVIAGDQWHFHVVPDPTVPESADRDPFLYLLPESDCSGRSCTAFSNACQGVQDEHFAFIAPSDGRFYLGIDDRNAGGGAYLVEAVLLFCGDGLSVHGESCDGQANCDSRCRQMVTEESSTEKLPNDNAIEANQLVLPASGRLVVTGDLGGAGNFCVYPDVFALDVPDDGSGLTVQILNQDGTACTSGSQTPYDIVLRRPSGEIRQASSTNPTTGCAQLTVDNLSQGSYLLYLEHDTPLSDRVVTYRAEIVLTGP